MRKLFEAFVNARPFVKPSNPELLYAGAAMAFEAGEAGDVIKKLSRGDDVNPRDFLLECGDVLYYMSKTLSMLGYNLEQVMQANIQKLELRENYGKLEGNRLLGLWLDQNIKAAA